ncbi:MAG: 4-(cytidine 5'-diphospho)-2-C-methyl-D-erythritol kinase [Treponema sp.]|jgi:4-diphosphocytidyl-2-C-methyl-D-erythritol kinase|nr:4-(cytidine 5'-diphospho)-2-C-methyl-D-erythritol kinase [Treponema sp.]
MAKKSRMVCTIEAPCKVNLHLGIGEKRPDGFHNLESLFATLAFSDTLCFELTGEKEKGDRFRLRYRSHLFGEEIPLEKNLVSRAVSLFRERTGFKNGLNIRLDKQIPVGAGLGGGSSDAASSLLAMNLLAGEPLSMEELMEMAAFLGSDVPFFLVGGLAFVSGCGELIELIEINHGVRGGTRSFSKNSHNSSRRGTEAQRKTKNLQYLEDFWILLAKPPFASDTATAYKLLDQTRERDSINREPLSKEILISSLKEDPSAWPFYNDFLSIFLSDSFPENIANSYRTILELLREMGASFTGLSGAGSCCYGIFGKKEAAEMAAGLLSRQGNWSRLTFFLARRADPVVEYR